MPLIITLTTDFGLKDHYVGSMKGVISGINPNAVITDITHEITAQGVFEAAFVLRNFYRYFPEGTVHVVVVDPGVGTRRKSIAVESGGNFFVGPDNGVFTFIYLESDSFDVVEIANPEYMRSDVSNTFHGRDIFAPAAAHIAAGVPINDIGERVTDPVRLHFNEPEVKDDEIAGEIIYTDRFGNLVTNIPARLLDSDSKVFVGSKVIGLTSKAYQDVPEGELLAIVGSSGYLEISVNRGSASCLFGKDLPPVRIESE